MNKPNRYLELNAVGVVDGKYVQCLELTDELCASFDETSVDSDICHHVGCAFQNMLPCVVRCRAHERPDGVVVFYKLKNQEK